MDIAHSKVCSVKLDRKAVDRYFRKQHNQKIDAQNIAAKKSKPALSDERFTAALTKLESGEIKKESITNNFKLTQEQINKLK